MKIEEIIDLEIGNKRKPMIRINLNKPKITIDFIGVINKSEDWTMNRKGVYAICNQTIKPVSSIIFGSEKGHQTRSFNERKWKDWVMKNR